MASITNSQGGATGRSNRAFPDRAFGVDAYRADSPVTLGPCLDQALAKGAPALIEVEVAIDSEASPWQYLMPGTAYGALV